MTKKQMKETLMLRAKNNARISNEWFRECKINDIEESSSKYILYRTYSACVYETLYNMLVLELITKEEYTKLINNFSLEIIME